MKVLKAGSLLVKKGIHGVGELLLFPGTFQFIISIFWESILGCRNLSVFSKVRGILSNWAVKLLF